MYFTSNRLTTKSKINLDSCTQFLFYKVAKDVCCTITISFHLIMYPGVLQWEESMGGSGTHAQSSHWVPLPAHQLQQIQRPMAGYSTMNTHQCSKHAGGCLVYVCMSLPWLSNLCTWWTASTSRRMLNRHSRHLESLLKGSEDGLLTSHFLSQIIIIWEHISQIFIYFFDLLWNLILKLYVWRCCCHRIFVVNLIMAPPMEDPV